MNLKPRLKYYSSIAELPIANFIEIQKTGNMAYLFKVDFFDVQAIKEIPEHFSEVFQNMIFEFDEIDLSIEKLKLKILMKELEFLFTEKKSLLTDINRLEDKLKNELEKNSKKNTGYNFLDEVTALESHFKFQIDIYKTSVKKYLAYKKSLSNYIKEMDKHGKH